MNLKDLSPRYLAYRFKYRYAKSLPLSVPVDVSLELASSCNQRCGYCYHSDQTKLPFTKGIMSWETGWEIIASADTYGVNSIKFNWKGEPTLNPWFSRFTALAKNRSGGSRLMDRLVNSNFKFDTKKEEIFEGLCNLTKVKVSFDSFIPEVMEQQRAGSIHALAMKNIDYFYNHPKRKNTKLVIQAVRTKLNKDEDIKGQANRRWPEAEISIRDMVAGRTDSDLSKLENRTRDTSERQSCIQAHARLIFNHSGNAFPCCPDIGEKLKLGNIHEQSIFEIFNNHPSKKLRKELLSGEAFKSDPCKSCASFETYKGYKHPWNS